jgi:hypothetical protein
MFMTFSNFIRDQFKHLTPDQITDHCVEEILEFTEALESGEGLAGELLDAAACMCVLGFDLSDGLLRAVTRKIGRRHRFLFLEGMYIPGYPSFRRLREMFPDRTFTMPFPDDPTRYEVGWLIEVLLFATYPWTMTELECLLSLSLKGLRINFR